MDSDDAREMLGRLQEGLERIENMLHRALHGSEPASPGIYKRLDRVELDVDKGKSGLKWIVGVVGAVLVAIGIKVFGGNDS